MLDLWLIFFASLLLLSNSICSRDSFNAQDSIIYIDWSLLWYSGILLKFLLGCTNPKRGNLSSIPMSGKIAYIAHSAVESAQIKGSNLRTPLGRRMQPFSLPCYLLTKAGVVPAISDSWKNGEMNFCCLHLSTIAQPQKVQIRSWFGLLMWNVREKKLENNLHCKAIWVMDNQT